MIVRGILKVGNMFQLTSALRRAERSEGTHGAAPRGDMGVALERIISSMGQVKHDTLGTRMETFFRLDS